MAKPKTSLKFSVNTTKPKTKVLAVFGQKLGTKVSTLSLRPFVNTGPGHKNRIEILTSILDMYPKLYSLDLKKFGNILAKILLLKVSMYSKEQEMQNIMFN